MSDNKKDKNDLIPVILMGGFFILIHGLALVVTEPFIKAGVEPAFEDINNPLNIVYILVILLVFTLVILLISKFWKKEIIQVLILGAIGYTAAYVIYPLLSLFRPLSFGIKIYVSDSVYVPITITIVLSLILAVLLVYILYKYPEWYIIDLTGILIGTGAIAIFGMSLSVLLVIVLLIILAIYDAISVYKTKHMIDLADTVMDLKLPVLLVIPKIKNYSLIRETKRLKEKLKDGEERDAFFMGLGDIVMPGILVASVYNSIPNSLLLSIGIIIGTLVGFFILMTFVMKGKPQAGLPLLCGGAILGYIISSLILYGELEGLALPF